MEINRVTKKFLSCLFTAFILLFGMSGTAYCSNLSTINQKMKHTKEKIKTLKLKENHEKGIRTILQVFKDNPAKKLYEQLGFKVYGETETHYQMENIENDL